MRAIKAAKVFPRPVAGLLRPAVHCPTQRYNMRMREGRGFSIRELRTAGISRHEAIKIGVSIDYRRRNKSVESVKVNVRRLKAYKAKLLVFPTHKQVQRAKRVAKRAKRVADPAFKEKLEAKRVKKAEAKGRTLQKKEKKADAPKIRHRKKYATPEEMAKATQYKKHLLPVKAFGNKKSQSRKISNEGKYGKGVYFALRDARSSARLVGIRKKKQEKWAAKLALKKAKTA